MLNKIGMTILALVVAPGLLSAGENQKLMFGNGLLGFYEEVVPPQVRCVGGEPTGMAFPQCTEGTIRIFGRAEQQIWLAVSVSPSAVAGLLDGPLTFEVNCNFNAQYRGPCWGSFSWDVPGKGVWEGQWTAPVMDLLTYESELNMIGFGVGGELEGKQLKIDGHSNPGDWYISFAARIKD
jgi:hypothetical protein